MAEVEKIPAAAAADIPSSATVTNRANVIDLGTSPTQERSSNSHVSEEYDTASDLESDLEGDEYDDEDDESITDDGDDYDGESDEEDGRLMGMEDTGDKLDAEAQKKVDEDRSNPQYIPKRGTFYEHDDRTAEDDLEIKREPSEQAEVNSSADAVGSGTKTSQSPEISHASKTMKKWQPASGVERWAHDRFDPNEQAPKSRNELVSAYGYDIRTEDAPPRARRRRRYGRGPSKYSRNWEDENAYLKASNKERKPPRPGDFPALGANVRRSKGSSNRDSRGTREEKENLMDQRKQNDKRQPSTGATTIEKQRDDGRRDNEDRRYVNINYFCI